tara:strand:+ start:212 stop:466 length:255 start_codon:yes stop_codon:yes gene_type:complete
MKYQQTYKTNVNFQHPNSNEKGLPFQLSFALTMLLGELDMKIPVCNPRVGTTLGTIKRYVGNLPRTRQQAFIKLLENGFYIHKD